MLILALCLQNHQDFNQHHPLIHCPEDSYSCPRPPRHPHHSRHLENQMLMISYHLLFNCPQLLHPISSSFFFSFSKVSSLWAKGHLRPSSSSMTFFFFTENSDLLGLSLGFKLWLVPFWKFPSHLSHFHWHYSRWNMQNRRFPRQSIYTWDLWLSLNNHLS